MVSTMAWNTFWISMILYGWLDRSCNTSVLSRYDDIIYTQQLPLSLFVDIEKVSRVHI